MPVAIIDGLKIHFERHGEQGEPLVLVHGYTGDITDWRHQLPDFSRSHRVLIIDLRGHGHSEAPRDRGAYAITRMAADVEHLVGEIGFERFHLLGHSMGGAIAQEIALRSPGRLMSLTLEDTGHDFKISRNEQVQKYIAQRHEVAEREGMAAVAAIPSPLPPAPHMPAGRIEETRERLGRMSVDAFVGAWRGLHDWEGTSERARGIAVPTLVLYGALDGPLVDAGKFLAGAIPAAGIVEIPEAAHSPQFERPSLFNSAVRRHLERNAGAAAK